MTNLWRISKPRLFWGIVVGSTVAGGGITYFFVDQRPWVVGIPILLGGAFAVAGELFGTRKFEKSPAEDSKPLPAQNEGKYTLAT